jgi:sialidase-1
MVFNKMIPLVITTLLFTRASTMPLPQLAERLLNASNEYKHNHIWLRGLDIINSKPFFPTYDVFTSRDLRDNIACFRIPSLVNNNNSLLALTEARLYNCSDCSQKGIVSKKSLDGGLTWSHWNWVVPPTQTAANPTTIYDTYNNKIILHYATGKTNGDCIPSRDNWQLETYDFGDTWSTPYNISHFLKQYRGLLPGPGNGIQIAKSAKPGRLVFPGHYGTAERSYGKVISYYSDDFGKEWKISENGLERQDESTLSVIDNGTLIMNMRNGHNNNTCQCRTISKSYDDGETWSEIEYEPELKDPICQGTSTNIEDTYFFVNPNMYYARSNLTIHYKKRWKDAWNVLRLTDAFIYTGYTGLTNQVIEINGEKYIGIIWTACKLSVPFRVWCSLDDKWELVYSLLPMNKFT